jgi:hypothetical protein
MSQSLQARNSSEIRCYGDNLCETLKTKKYCLKMIFLVTKIGNRVLEYLDETIDELQRNAFTFDGEALGGME